MGNVVKGLVQIKASHRNSDKSSYRSINASISFGLFLLHPAWVYKNFSFLILWFFVSQFTTSHLWRAVSPWLLLSTELGFMSLTHCSALNSKTWLLQCDFRNVLMLNVLESSSGYDNSHTLRDASQKTYTHNEPIKSRFKRQFPQFTRN